MKCIQCTGKTQVIDVRGVWRRRRCLVCKGRFSSVEVLADSLPDEYLPPRHVPVKAKVKAKPVRKLRPRVVKDLTPAELDGLPAELIQELETQPALPEPNARQQIEALREQRESQKDWWG